jgi:hypothetical protein
MRRWNRQVIFALVLSLGLSSSAWATIGDPSYSSASYQVIESEIGGNGQFSSASGSYNINPYSDDAGSSLGESAVGNSSSTSYQSNAGFNTTGAPGLTMVVNTPSVSLGTLSSSAARFQTATFDVTDYTSSGYVVQIVGSTPSNSGYHLTGLATDTASSAGTEQFGINTVRNTVAAQGANPVQVPNSTFSFGVAGDGTTGVFGSTRPYTISDQYRFNGSDVIASSPKSSGDTTYTITFMANIRTTTPGGQYQGNFDLVATGTF